MKVLVPALCGALFVLAEGPLRADTTETSARLKLSKGPGTAQCIDQKALARAVDVRLQRSAFREDLRATLIVQIQVEHTLLGWSADLTMHDGAGALLGRRSIVTTAAHCSALDDSLALVLALLVAAPPSAREALTSDDSARAASERAAPESPRGKPEQAGVTLRLPPDTPARREPWHFELSAEGSAAWGLLPGLAPGGELGISLKPPHIPEIRIFSGLFAAREERRSGGGSGARFSAVHVGLELCPLDYAIGSTHLFICAGQTVGRLRVAAFGFDQNTVANSLTYAALAGTGLKLSLAGRVGARLGIRAELPLARGVFTYGTREGKEVGLFETKPVTAVLDVGLYLQF